MITDFYEYGWGQSFHFAPRNRGESFDVRDCVWEHMPCNAHAPLGCTGLDQALRGEHRKGDRPGAGHACHRLRLRRGRAHAHYR